MLDEFEQNSPELGSIWFDLSCIDIPFWRHSIPFMSLDIRSWTLQFSLSSGLLSLKELSQLPEKLLKGWPLAKSSLKMSFLGVSAGWLL